MTLNFNPLETNLINLVIVIAALVWFLRGFLGGILESRRNAILQDLQDAENRLKTATTELTKAQAELAEASRKLTRSVSTVKPVPRRFAPRVSNAPSPPWRL